MQWPPNMILTHCYYTEVVQVHLYLGRAGYSVFCPAVDQVDIGLFDKQGLGWW